MKLRRVAFSVCILVRLGEKKRYPTVSEFNPDDESHTNFILSATCLFAVMIGLIPPKKEDDDDWLKDYRFVSRSGHRQIPCLNFVACTFRSKDFIVNIISGLKVPPYVRAPVSAEGMTEVRFRDVQLSSSILCFSFQWL